MPVSGIEPYTHGEMLEEPAGSKQCEAVIPKRVLNTILLEHFIFIMRVL